MCKVNILRRLAGIVLGSALVTGCGSAEPDIDGVWVTASMRDAFECQTGRVMVINDGRIVFGIAGRVVASFEDLETEVVEDGTIVMRSDTATFEFTPGGSPDQMTLLSGPMVAEHHTSRTPKDLARCG